MLQITSKMRMPKMSKNICKNIYNAQPEKYPYKYQMKGRNSKPTNLLKNSQMLKLALHSFLSPRRLVWNFVKTEQPSALGTPKSKHRLWGPSECAQKKNRLWVPNIYFGYPDHILCIQNRFWVSKNCYWIPEN